MNKHVLTKCACFEPYTGDIVRFCPYGKECWHVHPDEELWATAVTDGKTRVPDPPKTAKGVQPDVGLDKALEKRLGKGTADRLTINGKRLRQETGPVSVATPSSSPPTTRPIKRTRASSTEGDPTHANGSKRIPTTITNDVTVSLSSPSTPSSSSLSSTNRVLPHGPRTNNNSAEPSGDSDDENEIRQLLSGIRIPKGVTVRYVPPLRRDPSSVPAAGRTSSNAPRGRAPFSAEELVKLASLIRRSHAGRFPNPFDGLSESSFLDIITERAKAYDSVSYCVQVATYLLEPHGGWYSRVRHLNQFASPRIVKSPEFYARKIIAADRAADRAAHTAEPRTPNANPSGAAVAANPDQGSSSHVAPASTHTPNNDDDQRTVSMSDLTKSQFWRWRDMYAKEELADVYPPRRPLYCELRMSMPRRGVN